MMAAESRVNVTGPGVGNKGKKRCTTGNDKAGPGQHRMVGQGRS